MKKILSKAFVLLLAVALIAAQFVTPAVAVTAAGVCECDEKTRTGTLIVSYPATCSEYGTDFMKCDECGGTYSVLTAPPTQQHIIVNHPAKDATCTEIGWAAYDTCDTCDYTTYTEKPALGHDYVGVVTDPTCTEQGYTTYTCSRCGDSYVADYTDPVGHTPAAAVNENDIPATCDADGSYDEVVYCSVCGAEISRVEKAHLAPGHSDSELSSVGATCTQDGYVDYQCTVCGRTRHEVIPCPGMHDYEVIAVEPATCTTAEKRTHKCTRCGYELEEYVGESLGHILGDPVTENYVAPTCTVDGSYDSVVYCTRCGVEITRTQVAVDALGHTVVTDPAVGATCLETGLTAGSHCSTCGEVLVEQEVVAALGHDYEDTVIAPTCEVQGYTIHTCSRCGYSYIDSYVPVDPLSHRSVISKPAVSATCISTGLTYETVCADCGAILIKQRTVPIDPDAHNYVAVVTDPTCTAGGYTTHTCSLCGNSYVDNYVDALGHDLTHHDAQAPTCTEIGWEAYDTCSRCDYTTYNELAALGHDYVGVVTDPTCTEQGYTTYTCSRCGDSYVGSYVDALGHATCETIGSVEPTCTEKGYVIYKCLVCGETFKDDWVDELGHDLTHHDAQAPTCTEIGWDAYDTCSRCGYTTYNELAALGHDITHHDAQAPTCTEIGWDAYDECSRGDYTTYNEIAALGHDLIHHDAQAPTCTEIGWDAYDTCSRCDYTTYNELAALGHVVVIDAAVEPTFDETGLTEGSHCAVCGEVFVAQSVVDRKSESITFTYEATGINGSVNAVNSGFVTLKVYMNVESEIARLWGADIDIQYSNFLTLLSVDGCIFEQNLSTPIQSANAVSDVKITQDMGFSADKTFAQGSYLFATLTFKVDKNTHNQDAAFDVQGAECAATRDTTVLLNTLDTDFGTGTQIHVSMLGDANSDGKITSADSMALSKWFADADLDSYDTIYDMNKDGFIDGDDFALLRGAIVRDYSYLDI